MSKSALYYLLSGVQTASVTGEVVNLLRDNNTQVKKSVQASVSGVGAVSATIIIEASNLNDATSWLPLAIITLTGTTAATDGFTFDAPWSFVRARETTLSGTGATVSATMAV